MENKEKERGQEMLFNRVIGKRVFDMTFEERLHSSDRVSSWKPEEDSPWWRARQVQRAWGGTVLPTEKASGGECGCPSGRLM